MTDLPPRLPVTEIEFDLFEQLASRELSTAMSHKLDEALLGHLLAHQRRGVVQEDLTFALWHPSIGATRATALLHSAVFPFESERQLQGNVSFDTSYFERVLDIASQKNMGVALLHSHIGPGWQGLSRDDDVAESRLAGAVAAVTGLPFVGLTCGNDGVWSSRVWFHEQTHGYSARWCESVRVVGKRLQVHFDETQVRVPAYREAFRRTRTVLGATNHQHIARLRVGIIGLGSVGMALAEGLARSGIEQFVLVDFDSVEEHNLDRLQGTNNATDIGQLKVDVAARLISRSATAAEVRIKRVVASVVEPDGFAAALDCDVLFSCVDRPRARQMLNHIAYAHLLPVIDGGIAVRFRQQDEAPVFAGAEWQVQTAGPDHACLECLGGFDSADADTERHGLLDDPSYMRGLRSDHALKQNENVYPFSANLASLELLQFIALAGGIPQLDSGAVQRVHWVAGMLESDNTLECSKGCASGELTACGESRFTFVGRDTASDIAALRRLNARANSGSASDHI